MSDPAGPSRLLPLDTIDDGALPRDRSAMTAAGLTELAASIRASGLRTPVEVFAQGSDPDRPWGLISGFRRLAAFRLLHGEDPDNPAFAAIPATVRTPASTADAIRLMVEENDIRADISPWDQARIAVEAVPAHFETVDAAVAALYPSASRQRRARIRATATAVEELSGILAEPTLLSMRQLERLSAACRGGFTELMVHALDHASTRDPAQQWRILENVLLEAEHEARNPTTVDPRPGRPRRTLRPRRGLWIRREMTPDGWSLHFTGDEATGRLMERIMDEVELWFGTGG